MSETGLHVTGVASREWGYNTRGELISEDAENRLTQVAVGGGGGTVSYRYDPFGRRIARILGNITELTLYDGWNPVAEYANTPQSPTISLKRTFVWGLDVSGSLQGAGGVGGLLAIREAAGNGSSKAGQAIFPAYDGNGNIIRLTDSNGATVASYAYDGFGNRINPAASDIDSSGYANENRYGFSTKPRDPLTGLLYYGYRWYDPATGRWASRDPIGDLGHFLSKSVGFDDSSILNGGIILANLHSFLGNGSPALIDPNGEFPWATAAFGAVVGGIIGGVAAAVTGGDLVAGVVGGAVAGAWVGSGAGIVAAMVAGAGGGVAGNVVEQVIENVNQGQSVGQAVSNVDPLRVGISGTVGAVSGPIGNKALPVLKHWGSKFLNRWRPKSPIPPITRPPIPPSSSNCCPAPRSIPSAFPEGVNPKGDVYVIGRLPDSTLAKDWPGHTILRNWSEATNVKWIEDAIKERRTFYLATDIKATSLLKCDGFLSWFAKELEILRQAGYNRVGNYLVPPSH